MNPVLSTALLVGIVVIAWSLAITTTGPAVESATSSAQIYEAGQFLAFLDNYIKEVATEPGSSRIMRFSTTNTYEAIPGEDAVQFEATANAVLGMDYFIRLFTGSLAKITGNDVDCYEADVNNDGSAELVMENSFLVVGFQKVNKSSPLSSLNTISNIKYLKEKTNNAVITPSDTSIVIDNDASSSSGTGFSELSKTDTNLPRCVVHVFVDASVDYDVYYMLYAGADFVVMEVRNVK